MLVAFGLLDEDELALGALLAVTFHLMALWRNESKNEITSIRLLKIRFSVTFYDLTFTPASVAQRQSVGLGIERSRVRNSLLSSGFSFRQGN